MMQAGRSFDRRELVLLGHFGRVDEVVHVLFVILFVITAGVIIKDLT